MQDPEKMVDSNGLGLDLHDGVTSPIEATPPEKEAPTFAPAATSAVNEDTKKQVDHVLYSDIGVNTLLNRLKQSIASVKDFASFLKKRGQAEDDHAKELRRLCKATYQDIKRPDARQGSWAQQFEAVTNVQERMAENGLQFALNLHQMQEDLTHVAYEMEKHRKTWKQTGVSAEQKVQDAERQLDKAKQKYDSLAEDYDHAKTGDKSGRHFSIRGPKSGAQYEEELLKKLQIADKDYQAKVQYAQQQRQELISTTRPQFVSTVQELIAECDAGLALQMQKFAVFSEKLLLSNGLLMSPISDPDGPQQRSMRDIISQVNNDQDFHNYVRSFSSKVPARAGEIEYKKHPTLMPSQQPVRPQENPLPPQPTENSPPRSQGLPAQPPSQFPMQQYQADLPKQSQAPSIPPQNFNNNSYGTGYEQPTPSAFPQPPRGPPGSGGPGYGAPPPQQYPPASSHPPQGPYGRAPYPNGMGGPGPMGPGPVGPGVLGAMSSQRPSSRDRNGQFRGQHAPPMKPVFGINLEELFIRDQSPVPLVVYQCIQAVELFGLDHEGIYRISGNTTQVQELKALFNQDATRVDFRNPETFHHDVNNPANLLKQFLRELPDPLLTSANYEALIDAAKVADDMMRRDQLHSIINGLPDPNYATLRAVVLHLHRVDEHSEQNRMTPGNLAVVFAPTLMGPHNGPMSDASLQPKVIETILLNALQIFDED